MTWSTGQIVEHPYHGPLRITCIVGDVASGIRFKVVAAGGDMFWISESNLNMQAPTVKQ